MIQAGRAGADRTGVIFDIKRYAIHDGPGIRTTVFLKGCPLRCRWCQNPESWAPEPELGLRAGRCRSCGRCVEACPRGAITLATDRPVTDPERCVLCGECVEACLVGAREIIGRWVSAGDVFAEIEKDVIFYDQSGGGVTFSGGEPLMQVDFLHDLLAGCRAREIHTAVDTTAYAPPEVIEALSRHVDLFLCDLKHMDDAAHERIAGVGNGLILDNMKRLASANRTIIVRLPIVPGVNDDDENLEATGRFAALLGVVRRLDLLPYNRGGRDKSARLTGELELLEVAPPGDERLTAMAERLRSFGITVGIGG